MHMTTSARDGYDDNKRRAVLAVQRLLPAGHPALDQCRARGLKVDDLCDVLLMGVWVLWQTTTWRLPARGRPQAPRQAAAGRVGVKGKRGTVPSAPP